MVIYLICEAERVEDGVSISLTCFNLNHFWFLFFLYLDILSELIKMDQKGTGMSYMT